MWPLFWTILDMVVLKPYHEKVTTLGHGRSSITSHYREGTIGATFFPCGLDLKTGMSMYGSQSPLLAPQILSRVAFIHHVLFGSDASDN